jgi:lysophospholipase L1-like esterase
MCLGSPLFLMFLWPSPRYSGEKPLRGSITAMGGLDDYFVKADISYFLEGLIILFSLYLLVYLIIFYYRLRRPRPTAGPRPTPWSAWAQSLCGKTVCAVLVAVSFFVLLELFLAFAWRDAYDTPFVPDPVLLWAPRPGFSGVFPASDIIPFSVNSLGYRGKEPARGKQVERLLVVGDSFTFGLKVRDCETYSFLLGEELSRRFPDVEIDVVNAGVPGYSCFQEFHRLRRSLSLFHPRLVLVALPVNDVRKAPYPERRLTTFNPLFYTVMERVIPFRTFLALREIFEGHLKKKAARDLPNSYERVTVEEHVENMERIVALARRKGAKVFFVSLPHLERAAEHRRFRSAFIDVAAKLHVPSLDLYSRWLETKSEAELERLFIRGCKNRHPNSEGHREIARELAEFLDEHSGGL